jgi:anti-sigma B factor antagonist
MPLTERRVDGITIIDVAGTLTADDPNHLKDLVARVVRRGGKHIVLNFATLTYVDSAGLGELVSCYTRATRDDAIIALAHANARLQEQLELTRLLTIFDSYESEAAAIASFSTLAA